MSVACGRIHQGHEQFSDDPQERQEIFKCLASHSQCYLPFEALNVIVEAFNLIADSKSLPAEINDLNIE